MASPKCALLGFLFLVLSLSHCLGSGSARKVISNDLTPKATTESSHKRLNDDSIHAARPMQPNDEFIETASEPVQPNDKSKKSELTSLCGPIPNCQNNWPHYPPSPGFGPAYPPQPSPGCGPAYPPQPGPGYGPAYPPQPEPAFPPQPSPGCGPAFPPQPSPGCGPAYPPQPPYQGCQPTQCPGWNPYQGPGTPTDAPINPSCGCGCNSWPRAAAQTTKDQPANEDQMETPYQGPSCGCGCNSWPRPATQNTMTHNDQLANEGQMENSQSPESVQKMQDSESMNQDHVSDSPGPTSS